MKTKILSLLINFLKIAQVLFTLRLPLLDPLYTGLSPTRYGARWARCYSYSLNSSTGCWAQHKCSCFENSSRSLARPQRRRRKESDRTSRCSCRRVSREREAGAEEVQTQRSRTELQNRIEVRKKKKKISSPSVPSSAFAKSRG